MKNLYPKWPYPTVSVVICALNEEQNLSSVLPQIPEWVDEIILVDGHSTDKTVDVAKQLLPSVKVFFQPGKGKGQALKYGVASSKSDIIVTLDADGTYQSEEIHFFVQAIVDGNDFAKGTRFLSPQPNCMATSRQIGNRILAYESNILFKTKYTDMCSGFYAFRRQLFSQVALRSNGFEMEQELFVKIGKARLLTKEIPHSYRLRAYGKSKTKDFRQGFKNLIWISSFLFRS